MNYETSKDKAKMKVWMMRIDQILRTRRDRKGIIHTVSYDRRNLVLSQSKYADSMITHQRKNTVQIVEKFKNAAPPCYLVSPSMTTGWDFPYDECEFQIIGKLAFPDLSNPLVKARKKADPEYVPYVCMQQLVQAVGRGDRAIDDRCETLCVDDVLPGFMAKNSAFAPDYFNEAYVSRATIPPPAPKIWRE